MEKPANEITSKDQINREQQYMIYELIHDVWHMDRSYSGVYFRCEGEFFIKSSAHAVVLLAKRV